MEELQIEKIYDENRVLYSVTMELINQCNWKCKHCYLDDAKTKLELAKVCEIIDDARTLGALSIRLSGGEVTLYPNLDKVIAYARKKHMSVSLLSNMSMMSERVFSCIQQYGLDSVEVTLFSHKDLVHDSFVGSPGSLQRSLQNLKRLRGLGVDILVKTWAIKSNINDLEEMRNYFASLGYYFSIGVQIYSDIHGNMKLPLEEQLSESEYCHALYLEDMNRTFPLKRLGSDRLCEDFSTSIYITSNGDVIPCAKYRKALSNIYEESLKSIWETSANWHSIQGYSWDDCVSCTECEAKEYCARCGAMAYIKGNDFLENCKETCLLAKIRASKYTNVPEGGVY